MGRQQCLNFIGIGAAFLPELKNTSAWFCEDDTFYLVDCGESVFENIYNNRAFLDSKRIIVLITHIHCDHCGSLGSLISYCNFVLNKKILIFYPGDNITELLSLFGIDESTYTLLSDLDEIKDVCKNYYDVKHANDMKCFGYHLFVNSKNLYYSGDAKEIPLEVQKDFIDDKLDYIFQDTSLIKNNHHCYIEDINEIIPIEKRSNFYCMHLDSSNRDRIIKEGYKIPVVK
jgi:phosphoribosyl 1,2-cyclic phosphodiesterase